MSNRILNFQRLFFILFLSGGSVRAGENRLLMEFKKTANCQQAQDKVSRYRIDLDCRRSHSERKRFYGGVYLGKKPLDLVMMELRQDGDFAQVYLSETFSQDPTTRR